MFEALKTKNFALIQKTYMEDWRLRFSTVSQIQMITNELVDLTKTNDINYVRLSIDIIGKLLTFHSNTTHQEKPQVLSIQKQFTQMLLVFVRSNESDKTIILDSVAHIRKLIEANAIEQFQLIKQIFQQYDKSSTLLIAIMALMPQLYAFALLQNVSLAAEIPKFMDNVQRELSMPDWLSPLTNGFMNFYDVSGLTFLDVMNFYDYQQDIFQLQMISNYGLDYSNLQNFEERRKTLFPDNVFCAPLVLRDHDLLDKFHLILKPIYEVLNQKSNNFDALQILASASQYDQTVFEQLCNYIHKVKIANYNDYENLHEIVSYLVVKVGGINSIELFQHLLTMDMINSCPLATQNYIARSFYGLLLQKQNLVIDPQFITQLLILLNNFLQNLFISKESGAFQKLIQQYSNCQQSNVSQLWQILSWQPPQQLQKVYKNLLVQICFSVFVFIQQYGDEIINYMSPIMSIIYELKICSNISIFRFIGQEILYLVYCQLFVQNFPDTSFLDQIKGPQDTEYVIQLVKVVRNSMGFLKSNDEKLKIQLKQLLVSGVQDPQWRNRQQLYKQLQRINEIYLLDNTQSNTFPYYNETDIVADIQTPMTSEYDPSALQQLTDSVQQVRRDYLEFLDFQFQKTFGVKFISYNIPLNQIKQNQYLDQFSALFLANKSNFVQENGNSLDGLGYNNDILKLTSVTFSLVEVSKLLQYSTPKSFRKSYIWIAEFCAESLDNLIFLQKNLLQQSTAQGKRQRDNELQQLIKMQEELYSQFRYLPNDFFN